MSSIITKVSTSEVFVAVPRTSEPPIAYVAMYLSNFLRQRFLWTSATLSAPRIPLSYKGKDIAIALDKSYRESIAKFQTSTGVMR